MVVLQESVTSSHNDRTQPNHKLPGHQLLRMAVGADGKFLHTPFLFVPAVKVCRVVKPSVSLSDSREKPGDEARRGHYDPAAVFR